MEIMENFILVRDESRFHVESDLPRDELQVLGKRLGQFLELAGTARGRATFYDTGEEQEKAVQAVHNDIMAWDRSLYSILLCLTGVTDYTRMTGLANLLSVPYHPGNLLSLEQENRVLYHLAGLLPPQRLLKLFVALRGKKTNSSRARKLILRSILSADNLELWSVKYRKKLRVALTHAWGQKLASTLALILEKKASGHKLDKKENAILARSIHKNAGGKHDQAHVAQCVGFILGVEKRLTLPLLKAYRDAKRDLKHGKKLPYETLEGIRSVYHAKVPNAEVLQLVKDSLTAAQRMGFQKKARQEGVQVEMDPTQYGPVKLYLYGFEMGMSADIFAALDKKIEGLVRSFPFRFNNVGILVDSSGSMYGDETQKLRPMAVTLALRDLLVFAADSSEISYAGGRDMNGNRRMRYPEGNTDLAMLLVDLLESGVDSIFILSDGYENTPSGRVSEVISQARNLGIDTPIYQLSPVFGAKTGGIRRLSESVPAMPVDNPAGLGVGMLRGMLYTDPLKAISGIAQMVLPSVLTIEGEKNE